MLRLIQQIIIIFLLILFLAGLPAIVSISPITGTISWHPERMLPIYKTFIQNISEGNLGTYHLGATERQISNDIKDNFFTSLGMVLIGVNVALVLSVLFGVFLSRFKSTKLFNYLLNFLSAIPDFILIIALLIFAIKIFKWTGVKVISLRPDAGALNTWFPTMLVSIAPTLYLFKIVSVKYYQISGEDYIKTAVAKGMGINYINLKHIFKNIEPFILAELTKVISLAIGNLFIIEYLLNVPGITKFIFLSYETQAIAVGLFSILLISVIVYLSIRLLLYLFKRGLIHE
ncbi:ABC transporter permease subunit [Cytobacillus spongiae]|uniref:ABC transporter permease subunit n=1 Tax=Cytobacillus spongiae TaxID=2901381 RepID=UPI001F3EA99B|nr:ABC transporter permease subunit [Cytobacillus spongiae]UII54596.1 ABC transporter permease subunit [Cytobacillus spongiae]